jgi:hypothetical protein
MQEPYLSGGGGGGGGEGRGEGGGGGCMHVTSTVKSDIVAPPALSASNVASSFASSSAVLPACIYIVLFTQEQIKGIIIHIYIYIIYIYIYIYI